MPLPQESVKTPTAIEDIIVRLKKPAEGNNTYQLTVEIVDQEGAKTVKEFNLEPHLTAGQKTTVDSFLSTIRTKVVDEIL